MTGTEAHRKSIVEEMEEDPRDSLELAAAGLAVDVTALLDRVLEASGMTARALAERLGITEGRVSQVLNGDGNVYVSTLGRFIRAMGYRPVLAARNIEDGTVIEARPLPPVNCRRRHRAPVSARQGRKAA
jgi:DNA-binding phage protein